MIWIVVCVAILSLVLLTCIIVIDSKPIGVD